MLELLCLCLALLGGPAEGGPLAQPHPDMTDQELFWGSDQYEFSVVLPAAGLECFWHFAHRGEKFYLNYMVQWVTGVGRDRHLSVTINAPSGLLLNNIDDAVGQAHFETSETGFYQMCFSNFHNRFGSLQVFLSFGVYYDSGPEGQNQNQNQNQTMSRELNDTLAVIEASSHRVELSVFHMFRYYSLGRMRRGADSFLLRSNSLFISRCSAALSILILTAGYLQLLFLKRLFVSSTASEPRC